MNIKEFKRTYINHYLLLEKDFQLTTEYVTIAEDNFETYSASYLNFF